MNIPETITMLEKLLECAEATMPYRPNCTELNNVSPDSFEFVIKSAIAGLHLAKKKDDSWVNEFDIQEAYSMLQKIECRACSMPDYICNEDNYETPTTVLEGLDQKDVESCATFLIDYLDKQWGGDTDD